MVWRDRFSVQKEFEFYRELRMMQKIRGMNGGKKGGGADGTGGRLG